MSAHCRAPPFSGNSRRQCRSAHTQLRHAGLGTIGQGECSCKPLGRRAPEHQVRVLWRLSRHATRMGRAIKPAGGTAPSLRRRCCKPHRAHRAERVHRAAPVPRSIRYARVWWRCNSYIPSAVLCGLCSRRPALGVVPLGVTALRRLCRCGLRAFHKLALGVTARRACRSRG